MSFFAFTLGTKQRGAEGQRSMQIKLCWTHLLHTQTDPVVLFFLQGGTPLTLLLGLIDAGSSNMLMRAQITSLLAR